MKRFLMCVFDIAPDIGKVYTIDGNPFATDKYIIISVCKGFVLYQKLGHGQEGSMSCSKFHATFGAIGELG